VIDRPDLPQFASMRFTSRGEGSKLLVERALAHVCSRDHPRLLDLGCGSGEVAIQAAKAHPSLVAVALDISPTNVGAARAAADTARVSERVHTVCSDYLAWTGGPFDVIVSDGALQLIESEDAALAARIADDLAPGAVLIATLPVESLSNTGRILLRKMWRTLPTAADRLVLTLGVWLYPQLSPDALSDRLPYLRIAPVRLLGPALVRAFAAHGLKLIAQEPRQSPSVVKLNEYLVVWRRE
jgi:SAM-dependent methyltransferase